MPSSSRCELKGMPSTKVALSPGASTSRGSRVLLPIALGIRSASSSTSVTLEGWKYMLGSIPIVALATLMPT